MTEKKLLVYAPDKGGNDTKLRWLSIADVQDYWHLIVIAGTNPFPTKLNENMFDCVVADVSVGDFIEEKGEIINGQFMSYRTSDIDELDNLGWVEHD